MSLRPGTLQVGCFPHRIAHLDQTDPTPIPAAVRVAEDAARLVLAARLAPTARRIRDEAVRDLIAVARCVSNYRRSENLAGGGVVCAAVHDGDPVRRCDRDAGRIARWLAPHVGVRPCLAARRVGLNERFVIIAVDGGITVLRMAAIVPITRNPSPKGEEGGNP